MSGTKNIVVVAAMLMWLSGCALGQVETAHQLDSGDIAVSGTLAWPGMLFIPKASVNGMYGIGDVADISAHVGTTLFTGNVGAGGRVYLSEWLTLGVQGDVIASFEDFSEAKMFTISPKLTTAASAENFLYGGIQSHIAINAFEGGDTFGVDRRGNFVLAGVLGGLDYWSPNSGLGVQVEGNFSPVSYSDGRFGILEEPGVFFAFQASVGMYYRTPDPEVIERTLEPTGEDVRDVTPERRVEPKSEPESAPEFDDEGVPLY